MQDVSVPNPPGPDALDDQMLAFLYAWHKEDALLMEMARRLERANDQLLN